MIAYFALLSFVPLVFLALSLLGLVHRADESSFLVKELERAFPGSSVESIVSLVHRCRTTRRRSASSAASSCSGRRCRSSACSSRRSTSSTTGRTARSCKGRRIAAAVMIGSIVTLFVGLVVGAFGVEVLRRFAPGLVGNGVVAYVVSIAVSSLGVFVFLFAIYSRADERGRAGCSTCCRARCSPRSCWRRRSRCCRSSCGSRTSTSRCAVLGGPVLLLLWLYVMANVIVFGAELNWWIGQRRASSPDAAAARASRSARAARARGASSARFQSSPSSATVRSSPSGTKTGS